MEDQNSQLGRNAIPCPDPSRWLELAAGVAAAPDSERLLSHAAGCNACSAELRNAVAAMAEESSGEEEEFLASLPSSKAAWQHDMGGRMAEKARSGPRVVRMSIRRWALPIAAAALLAAGGLGYYLLRGDRPPLAELASAYTEKRPFELRIPGASYGPVRVERGAAGDRPAPLLESEAAILRHRERKPNDPAWLHAEGRADLLEGRYDHAVEILQQAQAAKPEDPAILVDLATAHFERGESGGDAAEYRTAGALLDHAIQLRPNLAEAYFNRAIVRERENDLAGALVDWEKYLTLDSSSEWGKEASQRASDLQGRK